MRLDQFLVKTNISSRSEAKQIIKKGRVSVNDKIVRDSAVHVDEKADSICVDGTLVAYVSNHYYMLNKPSGCVSATRDGLSQTVVELLRDDCIPGLFPVGRLDKDTEGLLIITDDGKLGHELTSPRHHVDKTYYAEVDRKLDPMGIEAIEHGMDIGDDKPTLPAKIELLEGNGLYNYASYHITICEGRFHQVKRMFEKCGSRVMFLKRISVGPLRLDESLMTGEYRTLTEDEINMLKNI